MGTAYFDCTSGISGNMVIGAMIDAGVPLEYLRMEIDKVLPVGSYGLVVKRFGTLENPYTYFNTVVMDSREQGGGLAALDASGVAALLQSSSLEESVREKVLHIFWTLVHAKAKAHGSPKETIRFRQEGLTDTIIDIIGAVVSLQYLGIDRVISTPPNVGSGKIRIGTREISIPAPMTRILLKDIPYHSDGREGELVTPTGAAIISVITAEYRKMLPEGLVPMGAGAPVPEAGPDHVLRIYRHRDHSLR